MSKFRKKPVVIEAIQYDGSSESMKEISAMSDREIRWMSNNNTIVIETLEGNMRANIGDWIIKGIKGECYPCKPDIFEATYERISEEEETEDTVNL